MLDRGRNRDRLTGPARTWMDGLRDAAAFRGAAAVDGAAEAAEALSLSVAADPRAQ